MFINLTVLQKHSEVNHVTTIVCKGEYYYIVPLQCITLSTKPFFFVYRRCVSSRVGKYRRGESILFPRGSFFLQMYYYMGDSFPSPVNDGSAVLNYLFPPAVKVGVHHLDVKGIILCSTYVLPEMWSYL